MSDLLTHDSNGNLLTQPSPDEVKLLSLFRSAIEANEDPFSGIEIYHVRTLLDGELPLTLVVLTREEDGGDFSVFPLAVLVNDELFDRLTDPQDILVNVGDAVEAERAEG